MFSAVSHAWQSWKSAKSIALLAILAFAVGIGATTAIFTVVNGVMLKPLPYPGGERYAALYGGRSTEPDRLQSSTLADLLEYQRRTTSFDVFGSLRLHSLNMTSPGDPQYITGVAVTTSLVHNIGVNPIVGRWFSDETGAVISDRLWRRLGSSPNIVGQAITLNGRRLTITGVMPPRFRLPAGGTGTEGFRSDVWIYLDPLGQGESQAGLYFAYARRKPGVSFAQAEADVRRAGADIARLDPATHVSYVGVLRDLRETTNNSLESTLFLLFGAAGLLLLISCANVATLLLARAVARARETAIRVALGASRRSLALRYFLEGLFVSLAGAVAGVLLSVGLVRLVVVFGSDYVPRVEEIAIDWRVVAFAVAMAFIASALSSLAPLWQAARTAPTDVLTAGVRASAGAGIRRLSQALVVAEIALAFTLLAISTTLVAHVTSLARVSTGFDVDQLVTFQLTTPDTTLLPDAWAPYRQRLLDAVTAIPGITGAAFTNQIPLDGCCAGGTVHPDSGSSDPDTASRRVSFMFTSPGYVQTMGIPLRRGRFLTEADAPTTSKLLNVVVNEAAANRYWPGRDPIGAYGRLNTLEGNRVQVVGVVRDVRNDGLDEPPEAEVYLSSTIFPFNPMRFVVRSPLPPERVLLEVRRAIGRVNPTLVVHEPKAMSAVVGESLQLRRVSSLMMTAFGAAALLMATLGIFGVVSYSVRQRTVEMGTRQALGAVPRDLLTLVVGSGLTMAVLGVALGAIAVVGASWLFVEFFDIPNPGWLPFASSTGVVAIVAAAASFFPAWRATLVSPMVAIRDEQGSAWRSARHTVQRALKGVSQVVAVGGDGRGGFEQALLTDFVEAVRHADSPADALRLALATLRDRLGAESAMLLEKAPAGDEYRCTAIAPESSLSDCSLPTDGFLVKRFQAYPYPLPLTNDDIDAWLRWAGEHAPRYLAELQTLKQIGARLAVPVQTRSEILGAILLGPPAGRPAYGADDRQVLRICAEQFAFTIENARLTGRVVEQERLRRDVALAAEVQRRLLPDHPLDATVAALAAVSLPARTVGGDYYDFFRLGERRIGIGLADVSGKGVAAALIMSVIQASLRILCDERDMSLPVLAERMNRLLHRATNANSYATFFFAQIDEDTCELTYVNAGHNPPFLARAVRTVPAGAGDASAVEIQELPAGGTVLGLFPQVSHEQASIALEPGDVLVAYTDGVPEARNTEGDDFGEERLKSLLCDAMHLPASDISGRISDALKQWIQDAEQHDDLTFIVVKVNERPSGVGLEGTTAAVPPTGVDNDHLAEC